MWAAAAVGLAAGILSGMGVGGGTLMVIYLTMFGQGSQQGAQGVNLLYFLPCAAASVWMHIKNGFIDKKAAVFAAAGGIPLAAAGALLASLLDGMLLRRLFGALLLFTGLRELFKKS